MANHEKPNAIEIMASLERDAFLAAEYVARLQLALDIGGALLAAAGTSLLFVSLLSLSGPDRLKAVAAQLAIGLTVLLWAPMAALFWRFRLQRRPQSPEREFREVLDRFPETGSRPIASWKRVNLELAGMDQELAEIEKNAVLRQRIIASYALSRLSVLGPLAATGVAVAGACLFAAVIAGAGLSITLQLLALPAVAMLAMALVSAPRPRGHNERESDL
jgi:hypothetical protein